MDNNNGTAGGDEQKPAKRKTASVGRKTAPSARKRSAKSVNAEEQAGAGAAAGAGIAAAEAEPRQAPPPQDQADGQERAGRDALAGVSTPRAADQGDPIGDSGRSGDDFQNGDADRAANLAADLKSWMDARNGDPRGEVL